MNAPAQVNAYHAELCRAMEWLGRQPDVVFLGQGVANNGTSMSDTFAGVPMEKRVEMPVAEEMQVGMCVGMSLRGLVPICIVPRWNFALRAADAIVNHMDRLPVYSGGGFRPRVIVRTAVPSASPFDPGAQHDADFTEAFRLMLRTTRVVTLDDAGAILPAYREAYESQGSAILVERVEHYRNERARCPTTSSSTHRPASR